MGAAILVLSLYAFHFVGADTPLWKTMIVMFFFGIGLGFNFQPLTLAVQNAVDRRDMGVATSSATFTRQIGGTLGTAVFLSILFSQAGTKISEAFAAIAPTPAFQAALRNPTGGDPATNKAFIEQLQAAQQSGGRVRESAARPCRTARSSTSSTRALAKPFLVGFSDAMSVVFLVAAGVLVLAFIATLFLPNLDLGPKPGAADGQGRRGRGHPRRPLTGPLPHRREATFGRWTTVERPLLVTRSGLSTCRHPRSSASRRFRPSAGAADDARWCCVRWGDDTTGGQHTSAGSAPVGVCSGGAVSGGCAARGGSGTRGCRGP